MDRQGHNTPLPPFGHVDPVLPGFAADADPYVFVHPEPEVHQPQPRPSYWVDQCRQMEETINFKRQSFPLARIKKIMKADDDVQMISAETPMLFARACEMFILELTHKGWVHAQEKNRATVQKNDIVAAVNQTDYYDFLVDVVTTEEERNQAAATAIPDEEFDPHNPPFYYDPLHDYLLK